MEISDLLETLESSNDASIRANVALLLTSFDEEEVVPALCLALKTDASPDVRCNAAKALGIIGSKQIK